MSAGKGDTYRPVDQKRYDENYERIYGKKRKEVLIDDCHLENPSMKIIDGDVIRPSRKQKPQPPRQ
jgi:hypothetical protein